MDREIDTTVYPSHSAPNGGDPIGKVPLVYMLAPSFSGSTLLTLMLAQHPHVSTIGELKATSMGRLEDYKCSCGAALSKCEFWRQVLARTGCAGRRFSLDDMGTHFRSPSKWRDKILHAQVRGRVFEVVRDVCLRVLPTLRSEYRALLEQNHFLAGLILQLQGGHLFLDGSKDPQRLLYFQRSNLFDIKIIRMHRDGRSQCNSQCKHANDTIPMQSAATEWRRTIEQMDRVSRRFDDDATFTLKYEDLCKDPNTVMSALFRFLQLSDEQDIDWANIDLRSRTHHILGNAMRTQPRLHLAYDDAWTREVSMEDERAFQRVAGDVNADLGYLAR